MASYVGDTWKTMWLTHGKPCGRHMACHVSTCMAHLKAINMVLFVEGGSNKKENEGKKKGEGKKGNKERKRKERERRRRGKRKEPAGFPSTDDASTDRIHRIEKQSSSTR